MRLVVSYPFKMKIYKIVILLLSFFLWNCTNKDKLKVDVSNIDAKVDITRFEKIFYTAKPSDLPKIKKDFNILFPNDNDSIWLSKMKDTLELKLYKETQKVFGDFAIEKKQLENLFKHVKYYYPKFKEPKVITLITNISFEQKVVYQNDTLYISIDVFLGKNNEFYREYVDYPKYIIQNFTKTNMLVSVAQEIARTTQFRENNRTFLAKMIQKGKLIYTTQAFLPNLSNSDLIGYTPEKLEWCTLNEKMIWTYFLEKKMLYSTDSKLDRRFLEDAPFTKFYLDIDNQSPGRIGEWIGLQIVQAYMKNNTITLQEMLRMPNDKIFKKSRYKPRK